jgi:hypothetical protein
MAYPLSTLQAYATSGTMAGIPWRFVTEHASSKGDFVLGPDGVTGTEVIEINWQDLKRALPILLGYSFRSPQGTATRYQNFTPQAITNASQDNPIVITCDVPHLLQNNDTVFINGVVGNAAANGRAVVTVTGANTFTIQSVPPSPAIVASGQYTGGGEWQPTGSHLSRVLPWQHPLFNQLWVRRIVSVHGRQQTGTNQSPQPAGKVALLGDPLGGAGPGPGAVNQGPWAEFQLAAITLEFWRPPYAVRSDTDVWNKGQLMDDGILADTEWTRYSDGEWELSTQLLSREDTSFAWVDPGSTSVPAATWATPATQPVRGGVGQKVTHLRMTKKWYQVPKACLFQLDANGVPVGLPLFLTSQQRRVQNPITLRKTYGGEPLTGCVNCPMGGGTNDLYALRFLGGRMGEMLYEGLMITPSPLQLPPALMKITGLGGGTEPLAQEQYDVTFHYDRFDPPRGPGVPFHGHNLLPYPGDGLWYPVAAQKKTDNLPGLIGLFFGIGGGTAATPFPYGDFADMWQSL